MLRNGWSRRRFLTTTAKGGLGLLGLPALAAARTTSRSPAAVARRAARARLGAGGELQPFEQEIGREVAVYTTNRSWGQPILNDTIVHLLQRATPPRLSVSFQAYYDSKGHNPIPWAAIAAGQYDATIDAWAEELLQINTATRAYPTFHHDPERTPQCGSPTDFQNAYWHFRDRIEVVNAVPNLTWVVTLMDATFRGKHGGPGTWWPASSQFGLPVDQLVGVELFNRNTCHGKEWRWFHDLAVKPWQFAKQVSRPLFIGACGCVEADDCGGTGQHGTEKADWFDDALVYMRDTAPSLGLPYLEAFCYLNDSGYRIDSSPQALAAFQSLANDPFFRKPPEPVARQRLQHD